MERQQVVPPDDIFRAAFSVTVDVEILPRVDHADGFRAIEQRLSAAMQTLESAPPSVFEAAAAVHQEPVCIGERAAGSYLELARELGREWLSAVLSSEDDAAREAVYSGNDDVRAQLRKWP